MLGLLTYLGLSGLVVRDIVLFPDEKEVLLGTTFALKMIGSMLAFLVAISIAFTMHSGNDNEFWVLLILSIGLFAKPFEVIDFWFQSQIKSKYTVISRLTSIIAGGILKVVFVLTGASVIAFATGSTLEILLVSVLLILAFRYNGFSSVQWNASLSKAKDLLSQSWVIILAGIFALMDLQIDRIMIARLFDDNAEVGIYSVAVLFSESWYFVPNTIAASVFPYLIELRKSNQLLYRKRLQQIYDLFFILSFKFQPIAIPNAIARLHAKAWAKI